MAKNDKNEEKNSVLVEKLAPQSAESAALKASIQTYKDIQGNLSYWYNEYIKDPKSFGENADRAEKILNMNSLQSKGLWLEFVKKFHIELKSLTAEDFARFLKEDLAEDKVVISSQQELRDLFDNPADPKFNLEQVTISAIQGMSPQQKNDIMKAKALSLNITLQESACHKILTFSKNLWTKVAPVAENILVFLVKIGVTKLGDAMGQKLSPEIADIAENMLSNIGKKLAEVTVDTIGNAIQAGLDEKDPLIDIKAGAASIGIMAGQEAGAAAQKIVQDNTDKVIKLAWEQIGMGNIIPTEALLDPSQSVLSGDTTNVEPHA